MELNVFPNPASNEITISNNVENQSNELSVLFEEKTGSKNANINSLITPVRQGSNGETKYQLLNKTGAIVRSGSVSSVSETRINTADLPNGQYYIHLSADGKTVKKQVVIKH